MQYLRARYYDQNTGRFASVDPFEGWQDQPMSRHRYIYGNDNPITYSDPSGLMSYAEVQQGLNLQGILASLRVPGIVSAASIAAGAFISGFKKRLQSGGVRWDGVIASVNLLGVTGIKGAALTSAPSPEIVEGAWWIIPANNLIPGSAIGSSLSASIVPVEVFAKTQEPGASPNVWDLAGPFIAPTFNINLGLAERNLKLSYEDPGFYMGWGWGHETGPSVSTGFAFRIGIDLGISIPVIPLSLPGGGTPPDLPSG